MVLERYHSHIQSFCYKNREKIELYALPFVFFGKDVKINSLLNLSTSHLSEGLKRFEIGIVVKTIK